MWLSNKKRFQHLLIAAKYVSFAAIWNLIKITYSFYLSRLSKTPKIKGLPWALSVEPSGQCNLQCPQCPVGAGTLSRKGGTLTTEMFDKIIAQAGKNLKFLNLYFQGEPMLNPRIGEIVKKASANKIYTSISTNGHQLSEKRCAELVNSGLSQLIVSVDGINPDSYSRYRKGGNINKVQEGINNLVLTRQRLKSKTPFLIIQFLVFKHNENEIAQLKNWCKKIEADKLELKKAQFYEFDNQEVEPPINPKYSRYNVSPDGKLTMKRKMHNHCYKQWSSAVISWDGTVAPCCYDKDLEHSPGNINDMPLTTIWKGNRLNSFRNQIITDKTTIEICRNCPEGRDWLM